MVRSVVAEEKILPYLTRLARIEGYEIGLILGQTTEQRDYVIHLTRTPRTTKKGEVSSAPHLNKTREERLKPVKLIKDIEDIWVAEHAKHVTRMLPGGMFVLGIFVVGPGDVFTEVGSLSTLRAVLVRMKRALTSNQFLYGNSPGAEKLIVHLNSTSNRITCKSVNVESASSSPVLIDWKFQSKPTKWHQLDCQYELDQLFAISIEKGTEPIKQQLQDILKYVNSQVKVAVCVIDGEIRDVSEAIDSMGKKKKGKSSKSTISEEGKIITAALYIPCDVGYESNIDIQECSAEMKFQGSLASRVFIHQKATVEEAVKALKQDIMRSLAARLEMHWDSLIEEEQGSPEEHVTLHEPPRRVLVPLPHSRVALSDYLFPGEGPSEALISLQELLDVEVQESDVEKELEVQADPADYYTNDINVENEPSEDLLPISYMASNVVFIGLMLGVSAFAISIALQFSGVWSSQ